MVTTPNSPVPKVCEILRGVPFFQELDPAELEMVSGLGPVVSYQKDMVLFREGDVGEAFYVVLDGAIRISKMIPGGRDETIAFIERGGFFGEMALVDDFPRSAGAVAYLDSLVLFIERRPILTLFREQPVVGRKILWAFCRSFSLRLREANDRIVALSTLTRPI
jgi:CRP/FNR family cyclic AMP-dependent transcriptional regulator